MIHGLYLSTSGSMMQMARQEAIANNIANASTAGFKQDVMIMQQIETQAERKNINPFRLNKIAEQVGGSVMLEGSYSLHEQGAAKVTNNPLDVMIEGSGFISVTDGSKTFYTRAGSFTRDENGVLITKDGKYQVRSAQGAPIVVDGKEVAIGKDGMVSVDNEVVGQLEVADFNDYTKLKKIGDNLYDNRNAGLKAAAGFTLESGVVEMANVSVVKEMVKMIEGQRAYEANMKMISSQNDTLQKTVNDVGKIPG